MNSNSTDDTDKLIREVFCELLESSVKSTREMGVHFDQEAQSYFELPTNGSATYFASYSLASDSELSKHLRDILERNLTAMPNRIPDKLAALAFSLRDKEMEQTSELSGLVYTLF